MTLLLEIEGMVNGLKQKVFQQEQQMQGLVKQNEILMKENKSLKEKKESKDLT